MRRLLKASVLFIAALYVSVIIAPSFLYQGLLPPPDPYTPLLNTVFFSTVAALIVFPAALLLAFFISKRGVGGVIPLLTFSAAIPHTAIGLLLLPLFTRLGIVDTAPAIIISMMVVSLPVGVGALIATFTSAQRSLDEFLQPLGLNDLQIIWFHVKSSAVGVAAAVILMWLRNFSELGAFLIVANRPATVGIYLFELFNKGGAAASILYSIVLALIGIVFSAGLYLISRRSAVV
ncbi:MAG: hypothetical protein NZ570_02630 [Candidatus Caldarchaeum sp.]|nr:hypothetical protein [Candidatus Caldarchaeum sp.]